MNRQHAHAQLAAGFVRALGVQQGGQDLGVFAAIAGDEDRGRLLLRHWVAERHDRAMAESMMGGR